MQRFAGRTALITGGASGIGRATAIRLAEEGAAITIVDVDADGLAATAELATKAGDGRAVGVIEGDVSDPAVAPAAVESVVAGHGRLDVLCNVAGILRTAHTHEVPIELWDRIIAINLTGTFLFCRAAIPALLDAQGNIVNVSSTAALQGHAWAAAYAASKGGVLSLTHTIAVEYGRQGVRCNAVCPGSIDTPMIESFEIPEGADITLVNRLMALDKSRGPETVASSIAFLASDDAAHINGEHVRIDGGTQA